MRQRDQQLSKLQFLNNQTIKTKAKKRWIFDEDLQNMIEELWEFLDEELAKSYEGIYIETSKKFIQIKVEDSTKYIKKLIKCSFEHTKADEKAFNTRIHLNFTQKSKAPLITIVWKFDIYNTDKIQSETLKFLLHGIELIID